jgi:DNA-binding NarL/FixJ family response regulator
MPGSRVVILSTHSLFVEGVARRLREHLSEAQLQTIDARQANALDLVAAAQPGTIIMDATDAEAAQMCPLSKLLNALPLVTIIRLDPQQENVQVVTSQQRPAVQVSDLVDVIKSIQTSTGAEFERKEEGGSRPENH